jgi:hypothetical protein
LFVDLIEFEEMIGPDLLLFELELFQRQLVLKLLHIVVDPQQIVELLD